MSLRLSAPRPLAVVHRLDEFACGETALDEWLKRRAMANQLSGASRTFVVADPDNRVFGYYALAAGAVSHQEATGAVRRNMPSPIPVVILARLAVDRSLQGKGFGTALLRDALLKTVRAADTIGVRALLIHALDEDAAAFYEKFGFSRSPADSLVLMMPLKAVMERISDK